MLEMEKKVQKEEEEMVCSLTIFLKNSNFPCSIVFEASCLSLPELNTDIYRLATQRENNLFSTYSV